MSAVWGVTLGLGLFSIWWSTWQVPVQQSTRPRSARLEDALHQAGIHNVSAQGLLGACAVSGTIVFLLFLALTRSLPIAACFGLFGSWIPIAAVRWRAARRSALLRELWPDAVDNLRSAIRAGLTLPEALTQLGEKGPEELRGAFVDFGADYRSSGQFDAALSRLKVRLADPVGDRIVEALRMTREVGGSDLGRLLGTLSEFLRESARTRRELEARQSWTVNAARLAVAAPWMVLMLLVSRPEALSAYSTTTGALVLLGGLLISVGSYRLMLRIGVLPQEERVLR